MMTISMALRHALPPSRRAILHGKYILAFLMWVIFRSRGLCAEDRCMARRDMIFTLCYILSRWADAEPRQQKSFYGYLR